MLVFGSANDSTGSDGDTFGPKMFHAHTEGIFSFWVAHVGSGRSTCAMFSAMSQHPKHHRAAPVSQQVPHMRDLLRSHGGRELLH